MRRLLAFLLAVPLAGCLTDLPPPDMSKLSTPGAVPQNYRALLAKRLTQLPFVDQVALSTATISEPRDGWAGIAWGGVIPIGCVSWERQNIFGKQITEYTLYFFNVGRPMVGDKWVSAGECGPMSPFYEARKASELASAGG